MGHRPNLLRLSEQGGEDHLHSPHRDNHGDENRRRMTRAETDSRSPSLVTAPSRRARFDALGENPREMALIGKPRVQSDRAQRLIGIENELLCPLYALMK